MYVVIRRYRAAPELMDLLESSQAEIERLVRDVRGFIDYYLVRTADGGVSVTVCEDRRGAEESNLLAADWITEHGLSVHGNAPEIIEGETSVHLTKKT
jgi:hypothetical protein